MSKIKSLFSKYREAILYVVFGVLTTVVNFVVFKVCNMVFGEKFYLISNVVAWLASVIFAYVTNKLFVFESKSWEPKVLLREIPAFAGARVLSLGIEELGLWLLVDICRMENISWRIFSFDIEGSMIAKLILAVVVVILNYIFSKLVIFKKNRSKNK